MAGEAIGCLCASGCAFVALWFIASYKSVDQTEMAISYNWVMQTVSPEPIYSPGVYMSYGWWNTFLKYPKTIQTINYDQRHRDLLDGRTSDGLPLVLGLSFQYQLIPQEISKLYMQYEWRYQNYVEVYKLMGIHLCTEMATNYTAYEFFNDKQRIAMEMRLVMNNFFRSNLHATVELLQINDDDLPEPFTDMILLAATEKQNISKSEKTMGAQIVQMQTAVKVAQAQANVTIQKAVGQSAAIVQAGAADAAVISSYVTSELTAYQQIKSELGLEGDALLKYIWYDAVGGGSVISPGSEFSVFSGVNPGAYIQEEAGSR